MKNTGNETFSDCSALVDLRKHFLIPNIEGVYTVKDSKDRLVEVYCIKEHALSGNKLKKPWLLVSFDSFMR